MEMNWTPTSPAESHSRRPTADGAMTQQRFDPKLVENIREVIELEGASLLSIAKDGIDEKYALALQMIFQCRGKVVLTGVGKSGLIARKIAATMASTGTLAVFMHPTEAMHGDLGMLSSEDIVIAIGKSGESEEVNNLIPAIRHIGAKLITLTSRRDSTLAKAADVNLHIPITKEACPLDLAPTVSTTVTLAVGDALAVSLMKMKNFRSEDFARFHPGGKLGKQLLLKVSDILVPISELRPLDAKRANIKDVIVELARSGVGIVLFSQDGKSLDGVLTDGDIRNLLNRHDEKVFKLNLNEVINRTPQTVSHDILAVEALKFMENRPKPLNVVPVMDGNKLLGIARLHDLISVS